MSIANKRKMPYVFYAEMSLLGSIQGCSWNIIIYLNSFKLFTLKVTKLLILKGLVISFMYLAFFRSMSSPTLDDCIAAVKFILR